MTKRDKRDKRIYTKARWRRLRLHQLSIEPLSAVCARPATDVHHIIPIADVRRHYKQEFRKTYLTMSVTSESGAENPHNHAGDFDQTGQTHTEVCVEAV